MYKKKIFLVILSYLIFFGLFSIALFLCIKWGLNYRNVGYYNKEIFPLYGSQKYDEFIYKTTNIYNADIQKSNLYQYEYSSYLDGLSYRIIIKKIKKRKTKEEGIIIYFNKLFFTSKKKIIYDLMYSERETPAKDNYKYLGWVSIEFSVKDSNFAKKNASALQTKIDPYQPIIFYSSWFGKNNYLTGIKLKFNNNIINQDSYGEKNYLIISSKESYFKDEEAITKQYFSFDNLSKLDNNDTNNFIKPNYKAYNQVLISLIVGIILLFIITFYLVFLNKLVIKTIKEKRALKRELANKIKTTELSPSQEINQDE